MTQTSQAATPATVTLGRMFADPFHDDVGTWILGYAPYGGGEFGEVLAVANAVGDGDDSAFYDAWMASGERILRDAVERDAAGHTASAVAAYLRASSQFGSAYHPLYGTPVDPRLLDAYRRQIAAFEAGLARLDVPVERQEFGFDGATLPYYLLPARGYETQKRPTIILVNGYDATVTDVYFMHAVAATRRGYHCVIFDGPGQGGVLYEQGVPLRPDWETVVAAVIEEVISSPIVDAERIVVHGVSLGGYLAPRSATGDSPIAACIADPGQWDLGESVNRMLLGFGASPAQASGAEPVDPAILARAQAAIEANRSLRFSIIQRGFWANGVSTLAAVDRQDPPVHLARPGRPAHLPRSVHASGERPARRRRTRDGSRRLPRHDHGVHRRRGCRGPLRDEESIARERSGPRLARRDARRRLTRVSAAAAARRPAGRGTRPASPPRGCGPRGDRAPHRTRPTR